MTCSGQEAWTYSLLACTSCYLHQYICKSQCPTLWIPSAPISSDNPYTCTAPDSTKRLIFNFHQFKYAIGDPDNPSLYAFHGPDIDNNPETLPLPGIQRGLYFPNSEVFLSKSSGSILLSFDHTWIFWIKVDSSQGSNYLLSKRNNSGEMSMHIKITSGGYILFGRIYCIETFSQTQTLATMSIGDNTWNIIKITQAYSFTSYSTYLYTTTVYTNNIGISGTTIAGSLYHYDDPSYDDLRIGNGIVGWIFQLIYVPGLDTYAWPNDYTVGNQITCPKSLDPLCLVDCTVNQFVDDNGLCANCQTTCSYCIRIQNCSPCGLDCQSGCSISGVFNGCDTSPCTPAISSSSITASFSTDFLKIQFSFTVAADGSSSGCTNLFDSSTYSAFGYSPTCIFNTDFTKLVVNLGKGYTFGGGSAVFIAGALKNRADTCDTPSVTVQVPIPDPSSSPMPKFALLAPSEVIIMCQNLILNGITDPGWPNEQYKWDISSDPASATISSYSTEYSSTFASITIPQSKLVEAIITVSIKVKNPFNILSITQTVKVTAAPKLSITFDSTIAKTISRLKSYSLSISSISACATISSLKITWSIASVTNNMTSIDETSLWSSNKLSSFTLIIPPGVLPSLSTITFHVHGYDSVNKLEGDADLTIQTDSSDPIILFDRTDGQIGVNQQLVIDASGSYDPDGTKSSMIYLWTCTVSSSDCSNIIQDTSAIKLTVPTNSLNVGGIYTFTLKITKSPWNPIHSTNSASKSIIITCIQKTVPAINIYEKTVAYGKPSPNAAYRIGIQGLSDKDTVLWSVVKGSSIEIVTPLNSAALVIKEGSLLQGQSYTLQALINGEFPFSWSFSVNQNPIGGYLKVTPNSGIEMSTIFTIAALDWTDPDGDLPLQYSFGYYINNIYQTLNAKNLTSIIYSQFAYSSNGIIISASIYDSLSAVTTVTSVVSVSLQPDLDTEKALSSITEQINSDTTPPLSIPLFVSQIAALFPNREYITDNNYTALDDSIQNAYDISMGAISKYTDAMDPNDGDSAKSVGAMLDSMTKNPHVNTHDNVKKVGDCINHVKEKIDGKSKIKDADTQTFVGVSDNNFQVHGDKVKNHTELMHEVDNNMIKIHGMALAGMSKEETKQFSSEKVNTEVSVQTIGSLGNWTTIIKDASVVLDPNITDSLSNYTHVGTSFVSYDPIPSEKNATFSIISFNLIDLTTSAPISLNHTAYHSLTIPVLNFDPNMINITNSTSSNSSSDSSSGSSSDSSSGSNSTSKNGTYVHVINCSYLENNDWRSEGCKVISFNETSVNCKCKRLGTFTAMVEAIWVAAASNNAGDIINIGAFSGINWDNAIGLYFCIGVLLFHSILSMMALKMDGLGNENKINANENSSLPSSGDFTARSDDSIIISYVRSKSQNFENNTVVAIDDPQGEFKNENAKKEQKLSKFQYVLHNHPFIRIFLTHENYSHFSLVTIYSTLFLGNMFFIGLFYQNSDSDKKWTFNLKKLIENYDFRDFWAGVYAACFTFGLGIILNFFAKMKKIPPGNNEDPKVKKAKKINKIKIIIFYILSYGLLIFFCWSIILFSIQFDLAPSCKWVYNTILNSAADIFFITFVKIAARVILIWFLTKIGMVIGSRQKLPNTPGRHKKIDSENNENQEEHIPKRWKRRYNKDKTKNNAKS
ncbi:unnamed protein product [Blepharisma stoltei]|uniref:PKD/REJ-like domain-containing protein n=1 Tax=Blepharisma stoltei TaxID=1481888 RepID=A0AAU9JUY8_9CILI|nr:unnamed protein product [Blepharisma stoltei]